MKIMNLITLVALVVAFAAQTFNLERLRQANNQLISALEVSSAALRRAHGSMQAQNDALRASARALALCRGQAVPGWAELAVTSNIGSLSGEVTGKVDLIWDQGVEREPQ